MTCYDRRLRSELAHPCREVCLCCCEGYHPSPSLPCFHCFLVPWLQHLRSVHTWSSFGLKCDLWMLFMCEFCVNFQSMRGLSCTGDPVHVDGLCYVLWRMCGLAWRMHCLPWRCWRSSSCAYDCGTRGFGGICSSWAFLQRPCGNYGWSKDMATTLPYPGKADVNQGKMKVIFAVVRPSSSKYLLSWGLLLAFISDVFCYNTISGGPYRFLAYTKLKSWIWSCEVWRCRSM